MGEGHCGSRKDSKAITQISEIGMVPARSASFFILKEKCLPASQAGTPNRQDFTINVIDAKQKLVLWPLNPLGP